MKFFLDVGGTYIRSELHLGAQRVSDRVRSAQTDLIDYIEGLIAARGVPEFIGIAFAGQVGGGVVRAAPNFALRVADVKGYFESRYALRLEIANDLSCAAMAEAALRDAADLVALYVGTGIGGAVIASGRLVQGSAGFAGEIGHVPFRAAPFACGCGKRNCIELYASGSGLAKWLAREGCDVATDLGTMRRSGSDVLERIASDFDEALLHAAATMVTLFNPKTLVIGGGIAAAEASLVPMLRERLNDYALKASLEGLEVVASTLENAPLEGAKLLERKPYG